MYITNHSILLVSLSKGTSMESYVLMHIKKISIHSLFTIYIMDGTIADFLNDVLRLQSFVIFVTFESKSPC